jgi:hypothetical protein
LCIGAGHQVRLNLNPIANQPIINFDFVGIQQGVDDDNVATGGFDGD